jgi:hypothetical protein
MKQKILLLAFTVLSNMLFSQAVPMAFEDWSTTTGSQNFFIKSITKTDAFGNIYVGGSTVNSSGNYDILLAKYNSAGVQLWIQQYAGAGNGTDFAGGLVVTDTYAILTGGVTTSTASPTTDIITMKYSSVGVFQWASTYNGAGSSYDAAKHVVLDGSGNVYVTGGSYNTSFNSDFVTIKYNSSGTQQWASIYNYTSNLDDAATKVVISGSNLTVTGPVTSSANNYKLATLTYAQSTGSLTATNISTATTTSSITAVTDLTADGSNNNYIVGSTYVSGQGYNYYVQKLAANTLVSAWTYTYNGSSSLDDVASNVVVDASGNVYITGYSTSSTQGRNITTIKLNSSGANQWTKHYNDTVNGNDEAADMVIDASSNIYITGYRTNTLNNKDYYTLKYNSSGTKVWDISSDGYNLNDNATNICLDSLSNVIVCGQFETAPNTFGFGTVRYIQKDIITPTDYALENSSPNFLFYKNKGQLLNTSDSLVPEIKFYTHNTYPTHLIKKNSSSFVFSKIDTIVSTIDTIQRIDLTYDRVLNTKTYPLEEQKDGGLNYFLAHTGSQGLTGVLGNNKLVAPEIYTNIDLMYTSNEKGIKYYYIVKPGGNLADIAITFTGATSYSLNGTTNALSINSKVGSITFAKPIAYQLTAANATVAVTSFSPTWTTNGASNKYKFNTGSYTSSLTLVIEVSQGNNPAKVLHLGGPEWSTPFGGTGYDEAFDIKTDADGNSYWVGTTNGSIPNVSSSPGLFTGSLGDFDVYLAKFGTAWASSANAAGFITQGDQLKWTTYYGGTGEDKGYALAVNGNSSSGDIFLTGYTKSSDFNVFTKAGYYNDAYSGSSDAFVVNLKYNSTNILNNLSTDVWATYLGGAGDDIGKDIKINGAQIFIGGSTTSAASSNACSVPNGSGDDGFPVCNAVFQSTQSGGKDGFLVNLNTSTGLTKATYIGGSSDDIVNEISLSGSDVYFVGSTNSTHSTFSPVTLSGTGVYNQGVIGGGYDAFFGRTSSSGNWLSYYGGSGDDNGNTIKITNNNKFIIGGLTKSSTAACAACTCAVPTTVGQFPICPKSGSTNYSSYRGGISDGFLAEFDTNGSYTWGTYMGGDGDDYISSVSFGVDNTTSYLFFAGETNTMNSNSLFYDISDQFIYQYNMGTSPVPYLTSSDGYFGVYYLDNVLLHSDYCLGIYYGNYSGGSIIDMKTNMNKVHFAGAHYYFAGKSTNPNYLNRAGNGSDFSGAMGAYSNSQTWPFSGGEVLNPVAGSVNFNPDAVMTRINLHGMPMVGIKEWQKSDINVNLLVYPNPATSMLSVFSKFDFTDNITIEIINLLGQTIYSEILGSKTEISTNINISNLANGVYNVSVKGNKFQANRLFIKQ